MLKLYGHANTLSANTLKLRLALTEVGEAFEHIKVDLSAGEQKKPEFLELNPHGKVPVLVDGDFALPESDAILWYIADTHPSANLAGKTPRERAVQLQWCDFASTALYPEYYELYLHTSGLAPEKRSASAAEAARAHVDRAVAVMEKELAKRDYLAGANYSVADIGAAPVIRAMRERLGFDETKFPAINAWWKRVTARPAWKTCVG